MLKHSIEAEAAQIKYKAGAKRLHMELALDVEGPNFDAEAERPRLVDRAILESSRSDRCSNLAVAAVMCATRKLQLQRLTIS